MKLLLLFLFLLVGCDVTQTANPDVYYKRDAGVSYGGDDFIGVGVFPKSAKYQFEFKFASTLDLFTFRSCHREITQEEFQKKKSGLFGMLDRKSNKVTFTYEPQAGVEDNTYCPVEVGGYDADKGRHSWAFIDFENDRDTLTGLVKCNGVRQVYNGVSVCQSATSLLMDIVFPVEVEAANNDCITPESTDQKTFRIYMPTGRCIYVFRELTGERRYHRLTTIGYESILVRKTL